MKTNTIKIQVHMPSTQDAINFMQEKTNNFYVEQVKKRLQKSTLTKNEKSSLLSELIYLYSVH